jgi:hypothetical protein
MKRVFQKIIFAIAALLAFNAGARPDLNDVKQQRQTQMDEETLFAKTLHPFMRKNCAECHSEQSIWPVGPSHSHSNSHNAFMVFSRLVDRNDFMNSRFIKFASNKHFCKEHGFNCEKQDQVVADLTKLFSQYTTSTKDLVKPKASQDTWTINQGQTTHVQKILLNGAEFQLETVVRVSRPDYIKIVSVTLLNANKNDVAFDGIEVRVNGNLPMKATGYESFQRQLSFDGVSPMKTKLTLNREIIIKARPGDSFSVSLKNFRKENIAINKSCNDNKHVDQIYSDLNSIAQKALSDSIYGSLSALKQRTRSQVCHQLQLIMNKETPSQSVFVQLLPKDQQGAYTKKVAKWFLPEKKEVELLPILHIASNFGKTCYATANDVYCFGEQGSIHQRFDAGVQRLVMGTRSFAVEDKNNHWSFFDKSGDLPTFLNEAKPFDFGFKVKDLKIGFELACFLSPENELYCAGPASARFFNPNSTNTFIKVTDNKIKKFDINVYRIVAIDMAGKAHYFGREYNDGTDLLTLTNQKTNILPFSGDAKDIINKFYDFVITSSDNKIYGYANQINRPLNGNLFGVNFFQGKEISEGHLFTEVALLDKSICGLNQNKELFCRGAYAGFLKNESDKVVSYTFQKIKNAPKNIKKIVSGNEHICFLLDSNRITCTGRDYLAGLADGSRVLRDSKERIIYNGEESLQDEAPSPFAAPHIIDPI